MADIIRLRGSPHEQTQLLLPWYVNGTLDSSDLAAVERHLAECEDCREELQAERILAIHVAQSPMDVEQTWQELGSRLDVPPRRSRRAAARRFLRRKVPVGWAVAAQLAAAALLGAIYLTNVPAPVSQTYHTLGAAPSRTSGNLVVVFRTDASEGDIRAALLRADARVVDGPTVSGAYVLHVADRDRDEALQQLRNSTDILLAEPIDAAAKP